MDQEQFIRQFPYITMLCVVCIGLTSLAFGTTDPPPFECHGDICNLQQADQFCSEEYRYCRFCSEVLDDCFTPTMPLNCSRTCFNHEVEQRLAAERDRTCKPLPDIKNGAWSNESQVFELDQTITAICKTGFTLTGCKSWTCTRTGWRGLENENMMPSCYQTPYDKWLVGFICIAAVLVISLSIAACAGCKFWKWSRNLKMHKPTANKYDEEKAGLLNNQEQDNQGTTGCVDDSDKEIESSKPPLVERTISLDEKRKARESKTGEWFARTENELPKGRSDATLNTGGVNFNVTINTSANSTVGNVSASINASPESKTSRDASKQPADKSEKGETIKGSQLADAKLSQEETATSDQRQPLDAHPSPRPEIDKSGSSSTYPETLSPRPNSVASEARRGPPNDKKIPKCLPNKGFNGQAATGHDQGKMTMGRNNIPLEDINRVSGAGERKRDVAEKGITEGATRRDEGKLAVGRALVPLGEDGGTNHPRDNLREFLDNGTQEVTEQGVGKLALGGNNIPYGDIDGTPRAVNTRIQDGEFAGIPPSDVTQRDARKMAVGNGRCDIALESNGTYGAAIGHTPAIPALDCVNTDQISHL